MRSIPVVLVFISVLCLSGGSQARIVDMQDYAVNDTVQAEEVMKWLGELGFEDTLSCLGLVIEGDIAYHDTVKCMLKFGGIFEMKTTFSGDADFSHATFAGEADFRHTTFSGEADFSFATFSGKTNFSKTTFSGDADLSFATFSWEADFSGTMFSGTANFGNVTFLGYVYFNNAAFSGYVYFWNATFSEETNFWRATFAEEAFFWNATFSREVKLSSANFLKSLSFRFTHFHSNLYLLESIFEKTLDFRLSIFSDKSRIFLDNMDVHRLLVNWDQWPGKIDSKDTTETRVESLRKNYVLVETELAKQGKHDDLDACYLERREMERSYKSGFAWFGDWLLWFSCGYGVKPFYTVRLAVIVILIFALFYFKLGAIQERRHEDREDDSGVSVVKFRVKLLGKWRRLLDAVYFSVNTFTTVGYGDWYPTDEFLIKFRIKNFDTGFLRFRTLAMIEGLLGWLLLAMFLVSLGRIWIR